MRRLNQKNRCVRWNRIHLAERFFPCGSGNGYDFRPVSGTFAGLIQKTHGNSSVLPSFLSRRKICRLHAAGEVETASEIGSNINRIFQRSGRLQRNIESAIYDFHLTLLRHFTSFRSSVFIHMRQEEICLFSRKRTQKQKECPHRKNPVIHCCSFPVFHQ